MSEPDTNWPKIERRIGIAFFVNFIAFGVISVILGGDAINGRIEGATHILSAHGDDTVVSPTVWYYSLMHGRIVIISFACVFVYALIKKLSKLGEANSA